LTTLRLFAVVLALGLANLAFASGDRLHVTSPAAEPEASLIRWTEVRGRAGSDERHDLILAIDVSESTLLGSGFDLDGDGTFPSGRTSVASITRTGLAPLGPDADRLRQLDLEDSILMAEVGAAEALIERMDFAIARVGILAFSDEAHVLAELTSSRHEIEDALGEIRKRFPSFLGATNFAAAIYGSLQMWKRAPPVAGAKKSLLFLSDGQPTRPVPIYRAMTAASGAAHQASTLGIAILPFALGPPAIRGIDSYHDMARASGSRVEVLDVPAEIVTRLRVVDLVGVDSVSISNQTNGKQSHAVRVFPDGRFDGFLELEPGPNRIRIEAVLSDGEEVFVERTLIRIHPDYFTPEQARRAAQQLAEMLERMRVRSERLARWAEMQREIRKRVVIEADDDPKVEPAR
jgi:hypothetical protein